MLILVTPGRTQVPGALSEVHGRYLIPAAALPRFVRFVPSGVPANWVAQQAGKALAPDEIPDAAGYYLTYDHGDLHYSFGPYLQRSTLTMHHSLLLDLQDLLQRRDPATYIHLRLGFSRVVGKQLETMTSAQVEELYDPLLRDVQVLNEVREGIAKGSTTGAGGTEQMAEMLEAIRVAAGPDSLVAATDMTRRFRDQAKAVAKQRIAGMDRDERAALASVADASIVEDVLRGVDAPVALDPANPARLAQAIRDLEDRLHPAQVADLHAKLADRGAELRSFLAQPQRGPAAAMAADYAQQMLAEVRQTEMQRTVLAPNFALAQAQQRATQGKDVGSWDARLMVEAADQWMAREQPVNRRSDDPLSSALAGVAGDLGAKADGGRQAQVRKLDAATAIGPDGRGGEANPAQSAIDSARSGLGIAGADAQALARDFQQAAGELRARQALARAGIPSGVWDAVRKGPSSTAGKGISSGAPQPVRMVRGPVPQAVARQIVGAVSTQPGGGSVGELARRHGVAGGGPPGQSADWAGFAGAVESELGKAAWGELGQIAVRAEPSGASGLGSGEPAGGGGEKDGPFKKWFDVDLSDTLDWLSPLGPFTNEVVEWLADVLGWDPELVDLLINPVQHLLENVPEVLEGIYEESGEMKDHFGRMVQSLAEVDWGDAAESFGSFVGAAVDGFVLNKGVVKSVQPLFSPVTLPFLRKYFMGQPRLVSVNPDGHLGAPVYYVNGVTVDLAGARDDAVALSRHLRRPVELLHNPTALGGAVDWLEAVQDKGRFLLAGNLWPDLNPTTRQLIHVLYHAKERVSVVTHSQGCLIMRNALNTANSFSGGDVRKRVAWVAAGLPLRDEEIYPKPARFRAIRNADDPVVQFAGPRLDPSDLGGQSKAAHSFVGAYVHQIRSEDVWPIGEGRQPISGPSIDRRKPQGSAGRAPGRGRVVADGRAVPASAGTAVARPLTQAVVGAGVRAKAGPALTERADTLAFSLAPRSFERATNALTELDRLLSPSAVANLAQASTTTVAAYEALDTARQELASIGKLSWASAIAAAGEPAVQLLSIRTGVPVDAARELTGGDARRFSEWTRVEAAATVGDAARVPWEVAEALVRRDFTMPNDWAGRQAAVWIADEAAVPAGVVEAALGGALDRVGRWGEHVAIEQVADRSGVPAAAWQALVRGSPGAAMDAAHRHGVETLPVQVSPSIAAALRDADWSVVARWIGAVGSEQARRETGLSAAALSEVVAGRPEPLATELRRRGLRAIAQDVSFEEAVLVAAVERRDAQALTTVLRERGVQHAAQALSIDPAALRTATLANRPQSLWTEDSIASFAEWQLGAPSAAALQVLLEGRLDTMRAALRVPTNSDGWSPGMAWACRRIADALRRDGAPALVTDAIAAAVAAGLRASGTQWLEEQVPTSAIEGPDARAQAFAAEARLPIAVATGVLSGDLDSILRWGRRAVLPALAEQTTIPEVTLRSLSEGNPRPLRRWLSEQAVAAVSRATGAPRASVAALARGDGEPLAQWAERRVLDGLEGMGVPADFARSAAARDWTGARVALAREGVEEVASTSGAPTAALFRLMDSEPEGFLEWARRCGWQRLRERDATLPTWQELQSTLTSAWLLRRGIPTAARDLELDRALDSTGFGSLLPDSGERFRVDLPAEVVDGLRRDDPEPVRAWMTKGAADRLAATSGVPRSAIASAMRGNPEALLVWGRDGALADWTQRTGVPPAAWQRIVAGDEAVAADWFGRKGILEWAQKAKISDAARDAVQRGDWGPFDAWLSAASDASEVLGAPEAELRLIRAGDRGVVRVALQRLGVGATAVAVGVQPLGAVSLADWANLLRETLDQRAASLVEARLGLTGVVVAPAESAAQQQWRQQRMRSALVTGVGMPERWAEALLQRNAAEVERLTVGANDNWRRAARGVPAAALDAAARGDLVPFQQWLASELPFDVSALQARLADWSELLRTAEAKDRPRLLQQIDLEAKVLLLERYR